VQRGRVHIIRRVHVNAQFDQQLHRFESVGLLNPASIGVVTESRREDQRRCLVVRHRLRIGAGGQEESHRGNVAGMGRENERRAADERRLRIAKPRSTSAAIPRRRFRRDNRPE